jgi:N utilization substance protein B
LFAESYSKQKSTSPLIAKIITKTKTIDSIIQESAPAWPIDKLNKIDLAILRLAVYELTFSKEPPKAIIDEAVEIAKKYGAESSSGFVNGVLGTVLKNINNNGQK